MTRAAAIDIGTNSIRLLIADEKRERLRRTVVTGLGRGIAHTGRLSQEGWDSTLEVLAAYRHALEDGNVEMARAVMTAVGRNASDVDDFREEAGRVLGFSPEVISGEQEAALSYRGAVADLDGEGWTVVDIGGGSTEVVTEESAISHEIGSVALTDRYLGERPVADADLAQARELAASVLKLPSAAGGVVGVAGTWTSLSAMSQRLHPYDPELVHHSELSRGEVQAWIIRLAVLSLEETARLPGLDPARAPVILGGSIVAETVMGRLGVETCLVSEHDLLDGILADLL